MLHRPLEAHRLPRILYLQCLQLLLHLPQLSLRPLKLTDPNPQLSALSLQLIHRALQLHQLPLHPFHLLQQAIPVLHRPLEAHRLPRILYLQHIQMPDTLFQLLF